MKRILKEKVVLTRLSTQEYKVLMNYCKNTKLKISEVLRELIKKL